MAEQRGKVRRRMQVHFDAQGVSGWAQPAEIIVAPEGLSAHAHHAFPERTAITGTGTGRDQRNRPVRQRSGDRTRLVCRIPQRREESLLLLGSDQEHLPEE